MLDGLGAFAVLAKIGSTPVGMTAKRARRQHGHEYDEKLLVPVRLSP